MIHWTYLITFYLFSAGVSAGAMMVSIAADFINPVKYRRIVRAGAYIAPFPIMAGMIMLVFDLERPWLFWLLLTTFKYKSIMSVGAWIITSFSAVSIIYFILNLQKDYLKLKAGTNRAIKIMGFVLSTCVALYTGLLLSTLTARPLWNSQVLPVLLFISAVIDGLAAIALLLCLKPDCFSQSPKTDETINNNNTFIHTGDLILLFFLLLCTLVFLIGMDNSTESAVSALGIITSGKFSVLFWVGFVAAGIVIPLIAAAYELCTKVTTHRPWLNFIAASLALTGGYIVRGIIVSAGQLTWAILF